MEEAFRQAAGVASALAYMHDEAIPVGSTIYLPVQRHRQQHNLFLNDTYVYLLGATTMKQ